MALEREDRGSSLLPTLPPVGSREHGPCTRDLTTTVKLSTDSGDFSVLRVYRRLVLGSHTLLWGGPVVTGAVPVEGSVPPLHSSPEAPNGDETVHHKTLIDPISIDLRPRLDKGTSLTPEGMVTALWRSVR